MKKLALIVISFLSIGSAWSQFSTLPKRPTGLLVVEEDGEGNRTTHSYRESRVAGASLSDGELNRVFLSPQSVELPNETAGVDREPSPIRSSGGILESGDNQTRQTVFVVGANGKSTSAVDAEGVQSDYVLDGNGNLIQTWLPSGHRIDTQFDSRGNLVSWVDFQTATVTGFQYHPTFNKPIAVTHPTEGNPVTIVEYDIHGNPIVLRTPLGRLYQSSYNDVGRLQDLSMPEGTMIRYDYDSFGNTSGYTVSADGTNRVYSYQGDSAGRVNLEQYPESYEIGYTYRASGELASIIEPGGTSTGFEVDGNGLIKAMERPGGARHEWEYSDRTDLAKYRRPGQSEIVYRYNAFGDLTGVETQGSQLIGFGNNRNGDATSVVYSIPSLDNFIVEWNHSDTTGLLINAVSSDGITTIPFYEGEALSGLTWTGAVTGFADIGFDPYYRISSVQIGNEDPILYVYDNDGLLTSVGEVSISYDSDRGTLDTISIGNVEETFTINGFGELKSQVVSVGGQELYSAAYQRDRLGRVVEISETFEGIDTVLEYTYDSSGRLAMETRDGAVVEAYIYDARGNLISDQLNGTYTYNVADQLLTAGSASFFYTPSGELSSRQDGSGTTVFFYTHSSHLRGVDLAGGESIRYLQDGALNRAAVLAEGSVSEKYLCLSENRPEVSLSESGNVLQRFVYGSRADAPLYVTDANGTYRLIVDHRGSVRLAIDVETGNVAQRLEYDGYGRILLDTNPGFQPFGFAGGWTDSHTSLIRFGARDYDSSLRRWTTPDPISLLSGQLNDYTYVDGDPINSVDSDGLSAKRKPVGRLIQVGGRVLSPLDDGVDEKSGEVTIRRFGTGESFRAKVGDKVYVGDIIEVSGDSLAGVEFFIGGQAFVAPGRGIEVIGKRKVRATGNQLLNKLGTIQRKVSRQNDKLQIQPAGGTLGGIDG